MSTLESLSDDILMDIFVYLNASDICQCFSHLNDRFTCLLQSLSNLHLTVRPRMCLEQVDRLCSRIHTLVTIDKIDIDLSKFECLRCLTLDYPSNVFVQQLATIRLSHLEYLSISHVLFNMSFVYERIFSHGFPRLETCRIDGFETIETKRAWSHTSSLRRLTIGSIDFHVYKAILSSCPNLCELRFKLFQSYLKVTSIDRHVNLKWLAIESDITDTSYNDHLIEQCLMMVPNVEHLTIDRSLSLIVLLEYMPDYDWLASIIARHLTCLRHFTFDIHVELHLEYLDTIGTDTCQQLTRDFRQAHHERYRTQFRIE
jgi:hypothetical protein